MKAANPFISWIPEVPHDNAVYRLLIRVFRWFESVVHDPTLSAVLGIIGILLVVLGILLLVVQHTWLLLIVVGLVCMLGSFLMCRNGLLNYLPSGLQDFLLHTTIFDFFHNDAFFTNFIRRWGRIQLLALQFPRSEYAINSILEGLDPLFVNSTFQRTFIHLLPSCLRRLLLPASADAQKRLAQSTIIAEGLSCASARKDESARSRMFVRILEEKDAERDRQIVVPEIGSAVLGFVWSTLLGRTQAALWSFQAYAACWGVPAVMLCMKPIRSFLLKKLSFHVGSSNPLSNNEDRMVGFARMASALSLLSVGAAVAITAYNQRLATMCRNESAASAISAIKSRPSEPEYEKSPEGSEASSTI